MSIGTAPEINEVLLLLSALEVIRTHAPGDVSEWFCSGIDAFMSANGTLDECLNLKPKNGSRHIARQYYLWKRNNYLKEAWLFCFAESPWEKTRLLSKSVESLKTLWPELIILNTENTEINQLNILLFHAFKYGELAGKLPPVSKRQLHDIVLPIITRSAPEVAALDRFLYK